MTRIIEYFLNDLNISDLEAIIRVLGDNFDDFEVTGEILISESLKKEMQTWLDWFTLSYPSTNPKDVLKAKQDNMETDFRVFFLAFPVTGFTIIRILDTCYEIDKALCGTSASARAKVKQWCTLNRFEYLCSEELILWWETDLCELNDSIERGDSGRLSIRLRIHDIFPKAKMLEKVMSNLIEHEDEIYECGFGEIWLELQPIVEAIARRNEIISAAVDTIGASWRIAVKRYEEQEKQDSTVRPTRVTRTQEEVNEGIRKRIPFSGLAAASHLPDLDSAPSDPPSTQDMQVINAQPGILPPDLGHSTTIQGILPPNLATSLAILSQHLAEYSHTLKHILKISHLLPFLVHKSTVLIIFTISVLLSGAFAFISATSTDQQTAGFSAGFSQGCFTILSVYLTILPLLRGRYLHLRYPFWFWGNMVLSSSTCIASLAIYTSAPVVSSVLGFISGLSQVVCALLLVECIEEAVKSGSIGGIASHRTK